ncbi:MAG: dTMP kinase [Candidatus Aureabacteria bacterium]|nr:dTMP kinase [Candidatus Auribacterota bacterium]
MFITFEGCEGAGKSTQASKIYQHLLRNKIPAIMTYEPGGTEIGEKIRSLLLDEELKEKFCEKTELLLYFASRAQHIETAIIPALEKGKIVICDRFNDTTLAYQGFGRGIDINKILMMNEFATKGLKPDLTILIDIDVRKGIERSKKRNRAKLLKKELNRMEMESLEFHQRVRDGYLSLSKNEKDRFRIFSGETPLSELFEDVKNEIMKFIEKNRSCSIRE